MCEENKGCVHGDPAMLCKKNFKTTGLLKCMLWTNYFLKDMNSKWGSAEFRKITTVLL